MLWENIMIQYAAIVRAQRIMLVKHHNDMTKELKKEKSSLSAEEVEYEIQFAWDKQATFMNAQSRAITTLSQLIERFDRLANADDKRRLELDKLKADIEKTKADTARIKGEDGEEYEDDGFKEALEGKVEEAWNDYDQQSLASKVSAQLSKDIGWRNRGAKERRELYVLANTKAPAILIELGFIDNDADMAKWNVGKIANSIVYALTGQTVGDGGGNGGSNGGMNISK